MCKICVFAGTSEGRRLIERLCGRGAKLTACVATDYGAELLGKREDMRILAKRLDAVEMEALFREEDFDVVVDATHPYADRATENIAAACAAAGMEYLRLERPSGAGSADGVFVPDPAACAEYLKATEGEILLTTGSKELPAFCADEALRRRLHVRVLPLPNALTICADCGIAADHIIAMQGPFDEELNLAMLRTVRAKYLVTKDTGEAGGYAAKIHAALRAGAQPVIIGRPPQQAGRSLEAVAAELETRFHLRPRRKKVALVGVGMGGVETRTLGVERAVREAECLIGAQRMLEMVDTRGKQTHAAFMAQEIARLIREEDFGRYTVLLSGDTGFYSGARALAEALTDCEVEVLPGISSLQYFCAKLQRPWEQVRVVSLHGREDDLVRAVRLHPAVFVLVGGANGVHNALARLTEAGLGGLNVAIGERLGYAEEQIVHGTAAELLEEAFDSLAVLLIDNPAYGKTVVTHGLPDEAFDRDETPMTKSEVRSISLSKMELTKTSVVFDIGSGSGSVTVEAALQASSGKVYAVEMKEPAVALTRRNVEKFHLVNVEVVSGKAPEALSGLPAPTHAFIGGSAGSMRDIIACLLQMNPRVRIVANTVTLESQIELAAIAKEFDHADIAEVSIAKPRALGRYRLMTAQNPVYVYAMWNDAREADIHENKK